MQCTCATACICEDVCRTNAESGNVPSGRIVHPDVELTAWNSGLYLI